MYLSRYYNYPAILVKFAFDISVFHNLMGGRWRHNETNGFGETEIE